MTQLKSLLITALKENQMSLNDEAITKLINYLNLMTTWNRVYNLTNILEPREMIYLHIIDSLAVAPLLHGNQLLDVGSGAGLPGIPLAILNPTQEWTLLDKNIKKTRFMTQAVAELGLSNVKIIHSRSEEFHPSQGFDSILSRALGTIEMFVESTNHLLNPNGQFIAMKGKFPQEELADLPTSFQVLNSARLAIKGMDIERHVICIGTKN